MMNIKVKNMTSPNGNKVANQFIIEIAKDPISGNCGEYFQSYDSIIAYRERFTPDKRDRQVVLDSETWDYSRTTGKYRNIFLGESKAETEKKIKDGIYKLADLN
jgi:hypothetical protein